MTRGVVVVGVGFVPDERAVRWAATEARDGDLGLRLVHALVLPVGHHPGWGLTVPPALRGRGRDALLAATAIARDVAPDLEIETRVIRGSPVPVLRAQARDADLVVLGSDGLGRVGDRLLGGVVRGLTGHIDVPLVVVPVDYDPFGPHGDHAPVIVGDDGTPGCEGAWRYAADRAQRRGVALGAVRVVAEDHVDRALVDRARGAEVLVLGVDHAWFHHRITPDVVRHAVCPVVVVPPIPLAGVGAERAATARREH
ncbi:universal stress protein [Actinomycetospora cinnamomea]|uniref:Nucleotide-binding universal stress UspA family protein n=1 Tax=Actinomycetospora cinnamomea TaxID=663609 RepID=A0A2U1F299_9PSEU|nr:universal stress protein [Actinomycetospora cinnamomea]PVZ06301.1 nucleotide-binding universal stress UspA family protein [Actinomycetospora cinnamomea]